MMATEVQSMPDIQQRPLPRYGEATLMSRYNPTSWASIFAGSLFGMMFQVWMAMLGVAIGASTVDPLKEANPFHGLGVGSGIWLGISIVIAAFLGGWVTGRLAGWRSRLESGVHGAVAWAVSNFVNFVLVGLIVGSMASGAAKVAGGVARGAGQAATAAGQTAGTIEANQPGAVQDQISGVINDVRDRAQTGLQQTRDAVQSGQAEQQARQVGDQTAKAVAGTSFGVVILMFLGLLAGVGGAVVGAPRRDVAHS